MNKRISINIKRTSRFTGKILAATIALLWISTLFLIPQQQEEIEDLTEYVEVTNVELIVRALKNGKPVGGLKIPDFILMENGKQMNITSLTEIRRKIGEKQPTPKTTPNTPNEEKQELKPQKRRLFLLYFWISERELKYRDALDYFFEKVYNNGDTALLVVKNKVFEITRLEDITPGLEWLNKLVIGQTMDSQADIRYTIRLVGRLFQEYMQALHNRRPDIEKLRLLRNQIEFHLNASWQECQYKRLISNGKNLLALANELKHINIEKWGMVFYQKNVFPHFDLHKISRNLEKEGMESETMKMKKLITAFKIKTKIPNHSFFNMEKIEQAFVNGDTTFHVLWMSSKNRMQIESPTFEMEEVYAGWMETFKGISKVTGGEILNANKLKKTLEKLVEREDIYYRLTYAPAELAQGQRANRKLEVKVNGNGIKVIHLNRIKLKKSV